MTHVLVPVDGSPLATDALRHAVRQFPDADLTVLHVVDLLEPDRPGAGGAGTYEPMIGTAEWYDRAESLSEDILEDARTVAADHDRAVGTVLEIGDPGRIVVDVAVEEDVDHVVLGSHARPDADRPIFGSVAEAVVRRAPCPVTVIR